jgi:2-oxoglutarate ferredoxin oxidoreductase subunit delta
MSEKPEAGLSAKLEKAQFPEPEVTLVHIFPEWCKGCGICVAFCPKQVLEMGKDQKAHVVYPERCIRCYMCARRCPDFAVSVYGHTRKADNALNEAKDGVK